MHHSSKIIYVVWKILFIHMSKAIMQHHLFMELYESQSVYVQPSWVWSLQWFYNVGRQIRIENSQGKSVAIILAVYFRCISGKVIIFWLKWYQIDLGSDILITHSGNNGWMCGLLLIFWFRPTRCRISYARRCCMLILDVCYAKLKKELRISRFSLHIITIIWFYCDCS